MEHLPTDTNSKSYTSNYLPVEISDQLKQQ